MAESTDDLTYFQLEAALKILGWGTRELAVEAGISTQSVTNFKKRSSSYKTDTGPKIRSAFERHGVVFISDLGVIFTGNEPSSSTDASPPKVVTSASRRWTLHLSGENGDNLDFQLSLETENIRKLMQAEIIKDLLGFLAQKR